MGVFIDSSDANTWFFTTQRAKGPFCCGEVRWTECYSLLILYGMARHHYGQAIHCAWPKSLFNVSGYTLKIVLHALKLPNTASDRWQVTTPASRQYTSILTSVSRFSCKRIIVLHREDDGYHLSRDIRMSMRCASNPTNVFVRFHIERLCISLHVLKLEDRLGGMISARGSCRLRLCQLMVGSHGNVHTYVPF